MEHFVASPDIEPIDVPYIGIEEYDWDDFVTYPEHKGWSDPELQGALNFGNRPHDEVEAFFQTWLYFGCLISVFKHAEIKLKTIDFIRETQTGKKYVTTNLLPHAIQQWMDNDQKVDDNDEDWDVNDSGSTEEKRKREKVLLKRAESIKEILDKVLSYAKRYCGENVDPDIPTSPISPPIALSIIALGSTLSHAATKIYGPPVFLLYLTPHWPSSVLLKERLLDNGWCPRDISQFEDDCTVDCLYYFSGISSPRKSQNHKNCTPGSCIGGNVNLDDYKTKHSEDCRDLLICKHVEAKGIVEIIMEEKVPLARWDGTTLRMIEYQPDSKMKYVAISHVYVPDINEKVKLI
jgi:hypothetical protein